MDYQKSYACRRCSNGHNLRSLAGPSLRRGRRPRTSGRHRIAVGTVATPHGPLLRGQQDSPTGYCARVNNSQHRWLLPPEPTLVGGADAVMKSVSGLPTSMISPCQEKKILLT